MRHDPILSRLREAIPTISVGALAADLMSLGTEVELLAKAGVSLLHIDVMDGCFVPTLSVGPPVIKAIKTTLLKDVHLMIQNPVAKVSDYVAAGADMVTVHVESDIHIHRALQALGEMANVNNPDAGIGRGIALNPGTPAAAIVPFLDDVEVVFLLAVNPGWGGQKFIPAVGRKLEEVKKIVSAANKETLVGIDGGINRDNIADVARMGADIIVSGSAVFAGKAVADNVRPMFDAIRVAERINGQP